MSKEAFEAKVTTRCLYRPGKLKAGYLNVREVKNSQGYQGIIRGTSRA